MRMFIVTLVASVIAALAGASAIEPVARGAAFDDGVGMVDPTTGEWHLRADDGYATTFYFGDPGDVPFMGDWDCDGVDSPGLYRQSDGFVYLRNSNDQGVADIRFFFGNPDDVPLAGDFDGDGCDTVSLYRPSESRVFIIDRLGSEDAGLGAAEVDYVFGNPGDRPFAGDFNGDGIDTVGLHRPSTGLVYLRNVHAAGPADVQYLFGDPGDAIIAGDWSGLGLDGPGTFRALAGTVFLRNTHSSGVADRSFPFGSPGMIPVAGRFGLDGPGFEGRAWDINRVDPLLNGGWFLDLIEGADGRPLLGYGWVTGAIPDPGGPDLNQWELAFTKCSDHGCAESHWRGVGELPGQNGAPGLPTNTTGKPLSDHVSLALGVDGLPIATYHDPTTSQLVFAHCEDQACNTVTYEPQALTGHPFENFGKLATIGIGGDGLPFAAYLLSHNTSYWMVKCADTTCSTSSATVIGDIGDFHRLDVARGSSGNPLVVRFMSPTTTEPFSLVFERCADPGCLDGDVSVLWEWPGEDVFYSGKGSPALALGTDGLPVVAFNNLYTRFEDGKEVQDFSLDVIHCLDDGCTTTTRSIIDRGRFSFVTIDVGGDGLPVIGYNAEDGVRVAKCHDVACTAATVVTVESGPDVGTYASLIVDPLGMPVIAYRDGAAQALKVARLSG